MISRKKLYRIIFKTDTPAGLLFDKILLVLILLSVCIVMLKSVSHIDMQHGQLLNLTQHILTLIFIVEYALRIRVSKKKKKYIFSFFGIVDFLSILPFFLTPFINGESLMIVRSLRLLRLFRVLDLGKYEKASDLLRHSLGKSMAKIIVFLTTVFIIVMITGTLMYLIEGPTSGFTNIPKSVYRAIVTVTTVGYGDITPVSPLGQTLSAMLMILGYSIIAVPTGIVTAQFSNDKNKHKKKKKEKEKKKK